jgi:hypothetical protein
VTIDRGQLEDAARRLKRRELDKVELQARLQALARQPEPPALVQNEPGCYHFRVLDPRVSVIGAATLNVATIGHCYHI